MTMKAVEIYDDAAAIVLDATMNAILELLRPASPIAVQSGRG